MADSPTHEDAARVPDRAALAVRPDGRNEGHPLGPGRTLTGGRGTSAAPRRRVATPSVAIRPYDVGRDEPRVAEIAQAGRLAHLVIPAETAGPPDPSGGTLRRQAVAEEPGGAVVGYSAVVRDGWREPGLIELAVAVAPAARGRGTGAALYDEARRFARERGAARVRAEIPDDDDVALAFARRRGFAIVQHVFGMALDLGGFDERRFAALPAAAEAGGIRLFTLAQIGDSPEHRRRLHALNRDLAADIPGNTDAFPSYEEYEREIIGAPWFRPERQFIAAAGDQWVGLVGIAATELPGELAHAFTAVARAYRGRGIAQALKVLAILAARRQGATRLVTGNDSWNAPVLAVNRKLGYTQQPGRYRLEREEQETAWPPP